MKIIFLIYTANHSGAECHSLRASPPRKNNVGCAHPNLRSHGRHYNLACLRPTSERASHRARNRAGRRRPHNRSLAGGQRALTHQERRDQEVTPSSKGHL